MAFYIRKAFKTGPVRLNLSKGGLGLSAGVTGARVGINSRGTYVHGGRHGLYYRKYVNRGDNSRTASNKRASSGRSGPIDLFHDTGVTYKSSSQTVKQQVEPTSAELPDLTLLTTPNKIIFGILILLSFGALVNSWIQITAITGWAIFIPFTLYHTYWLLKGKNLLRKTIDHSDKTGSLPVSLKDTIGRYPESWKHKLCLHLHAVIGEMAIRSENIDTKQVLKELDECCPADKKEVNKIRADILSTVLDKMLEDHLLSSEEEKAVRGLISDLKMDKEFLQRELNLIAHFGNIRDEITKPLEPVNAGIPLVRGEEAYEVFEQVRLLNERVLNRFQRDNVQYREVGFEIDMEGKLVLTDRRLILIDKGTREYRLNRIMKVTADPEAAVVELSLSNRKNPVLLTAEKPLILASRLEKTIQEKVK